jgi:hypothetical protein
LVNRPNAQHDKTPGRPAGTTAAPEGWNAQAIRQFSLTQADEVTMRRDVQMLFAAALAPFLIQPAFAGEPTAADITGKMAGVTDELNRKHTGKPVQTEQKEIVNDLDKLIASLEKQCQNCKNGVKRNNPTRGMRDSMISRGTGGIGDLVDPKESGKDWAKLSARERDRILQSMTEGFPPEYRMVLERYYRRLADEKGTAGAAKDAKEADAPKEAGK